MRCETSATMLPLGDVDLDPSTSCPVTAALQVLRTSAASSCGREVFCREGARQVAQILSDITTGNGQSADLDLVEELCQLTADNAGCEMAAASATRTLQLLRDNRDEWELHLRRKRCSSLTCTMAFTVYIDPAACTATGACAAACPVQAISGGHGEIHVVDVDRCTKCRACLTVCPSGAVLKAGPIKPRVPAAPVPVGSFGADDAEGGMRRRRRRGE